MFILALIPVNFLLVLIFISSLKNRFPDYHDRSFSQIWVFSSMIKKINKGEDGFQIGSFFKYPTWLNEPTLLP